MEESDAGIFCRPCAAQSAFSGGADGTLMPPKRSLPSVPEYAAQPLGADSFARSSRTGNNEIIIPRAEKTVKISRWQQKSRPFGRKKEKALLCTAGTIPSGIGKCREDQHRAPRISCRLCRREMTLGCSFLSDSRNFFVQSRVISVHS